MTGEVDVDGRLAEHLHDIVDGCPHPRPALGTCPGVVAPLETVSDTVVAENSMEVGRPVAIG